MSDRARSMAITLGDDVCRRLLRFAERAGCTPAEAAAHLIEQGLPGYGDIWCADMVADLEALADEGLSASQIAGELTRRHGRSVTKSGVLGKCRRGGIDLARSKGRADRTVRAPAEEPTTDRVAMRHARGVGVGPEGPYQRPSAPVIPGPAAHTTITAALMGDPPPGRSALDRRGGA